MADNTAKVIESLRDIIPMLGAYDPDDIADDIRDVIALVEQSTPKPMTMYEACEVFRRLNYRGHGDVWKARAGTVYAFIHQIEASSNVYFTDFEACCIARGLLEREAEKEAAHG